MKLVILQKAITLQGMPHIMSDDGQDMAMRRKLRLAE